MGLIFLRNRVSGVAPFDPATLFASGEEGVWYEPSTSTCLTDLEGFTFATYGQPVAHLIDKSQGATIEARRNLLERTEEFDNAYWNKVQFSIDEDTTSAPNGTLTADKVTATFNAGSIQATQNLSATPHSISIYAKYIDNAWIRLAQVSSATHCAWFNIQTGSKGSVVGSGNTSEIEPLADGWYRCTLNIATAATGDQIVFFSMSGADASTSMTFGVSAYIWGAQLEEASSASAYQKITDGQTVSWLPGNHATQGTLTARPTLARVPEGGRRNLLERTEEFDDAWWSKSGATTIDPNTSETTDPNGGQSAEKLISTDTNGTFVNRNSILTAGVGYTVTVYAKAGDEDIIRIANVSSANSAAWFNLTSGTIGTENDANSDGNTASITSVGDGWYRCERYFASAATGSLEIIIALCSADGATTSPGGNGHCYIWGAQLEEASSATAYQKVVSEYDVTEAGVDSRDYLSFDGTDDVLVTTLAISILNHTSAIALSPTWASSGRYWSYSTGPVENGLLNFAATATSTQYVVGSRFPTNETSSPFLLSNDTAYVVSYLKDGANDQKARVNGVDGTTNTATVTTFTSDDLRLGSSRGTSFGQMDMFSFVGIDRTLTAQEISDTETYLANRSGVSLA